MENQEGFKKFIQYVDKRLTRILFKIDRKKGLNEEEIALMQELYRVFFKKYDQEAGTENN